MITTGHAPSTPPPCSISPYENASALLYIPAQFLRESLAAWAPHIRRDTVIVSLIKGIERETGLRASEVITQVTGVPAHRGKVDGSA
ncbi:hypothetical protein ACFWFH_30450 [Streptomyces coelicoflavus]|uniref:hypothetical protein n=1 Tax=Streptomyces coelicoflavus TaxID=285562 RepID=UPI003665247F